MKIKITGTTNSQNVNGVVLISFTKRSVIVPRTETLRSQKHLYKNLPRKLRERSKMVLRDPRKVPRPERVLHLGAAHK